MAGSRDTPSLHTTSNAACDDFVDVVIKKAPRTRWELRRGRCMELISQKSGSELGEERGGESEYRETGQQERGQPCVCGQRPSGKKIRVATELSCIVVTKFCSLSLRAVSLCCRPLSLVRHLFSFLYCRFSLRRKSVAPDVFVTGEKQIRVHRDSCLEPSVHVTLVKTTDRAVVSDDSNVGVEAGSADTPTAVTVYASERRITEDYSEEVASTSLADSAVDVDGGERMTQNLGSLGDPIEVGILSRLDFELILVTCPFLVDYAA